MKYSITICFSQISKYPYGFLAAECKYEMYKEKNIYVENKTD